MEKLRMGVIGLGFIGSLHARVIAENPCAELVAVSDLDAALTRKFSEKYGCDGYVDYNEMLKRDDIDAVDVCVPEDFHVGPSVAVAKAKKKALFLEKPIAKTFAEAVEIKKACDENGVRLMINQVLKFDPRYVQLYDQVKSGALGDISQVFVKRQNPKAVARRFQGRVSFFYYLGVHDFEWMLSYAGSKPVKVYAQMNNVVNKCVNDNDNAIVTVNFESGALGVVSIGWALPENDSVGIISGVEIIGSKGAGMVDIRNQGVEIVTDDKIVYPDALHWPEYNGAIQGDLKEAVAHFVTATLNDTPYFVDTDNAILAVKLIEAAFKSIETGLPVQL